LRGRPGAYGAPARLGDPGEGQPPVKHRELRPAPTYIGFLPSLRANRTRKIRRLARGRIRRRDGGLTGAAGFGNALCAHPCRHSEQHIQAPRNSADVEHTTNQTLAGPASGKGLVAPEPSWDRRQGLKELGGDLHWRWWRSLRAITGARRHLQMSLEAVFFLTGQRSKVFCSNAPDGPAGPNLLGTSAAEGSSTDARLPSRDGNYSPGLDDGGVLIRRHGESATVEGRSTVLVELGAPR